MENSKDNKKDNSTKGKKDKMDERVKNLFAEQDPPSYASIREVDAMKARIAELEEKLAQQEMAATQKQRLTDTAEEVTANQDGSQPVEMPAAETESVVTALEPTTGRFQLPAIRSALGKAVKAGLSWLPANLVTIITITMMVLVAAWSITSGSVTALFNISNWKTLSTQVILLLVLAVVVLLLLGFFLVRQFRAYPLRARLTASFLVLTIVPLAIVGRQTYLSTYEILESQIQNEILRSSITTSSEFQDFFDTQFNTMRVQARSSELVAYLQTPEALRAGSEQETLALEKLKTFTKNKSVYIMSYALVDLNGTNVLDTNKTRIGSSYAGQEFFDYVKTNETVYASGLIMLTDGDRVMYLAAPISSSGELVGVFVAALQPKYIQETIELLLRNNRGDLSQLATEHTYVIDGDNYFVLGHSIRKDLLYKTYLSPSDPKLAKLVEMGVDQERLNRLVDYQPEVLAGLSGMADTSIFEAPAYDGSLTQSAAVRLPDSNWIVVTARNVDTISGAIQNQTRTNVTTSIFIIAFVALFALVASRFFTRPIIELTNVAESISAGDLTKKAAVRSSDEIGVLAQTFNTMTEQIQALVTGLEKRVQDRTHDLELATDVGSAVAEKTGDLNELLTESVKLIRARYELYYTQVYLLDGAGRYLVLRAGTGEIGEALLRRGHRLAVSANSLNSRAVVSQKPVLVGDTHKNENFLPNPLLPLTRSELAVPLISNGRVVGVLDMQSDAPDTFNESNLSAFQILSGQLAIAIQNSLLFNQMNEARLQVEEQSRRLTSAGWQDFLNAVERSETIGYEFNQTGVQPLADSHSMPDDHALTVPIMVAGSSIGEVQIADDKTRVWSLVEAEIIESVVSRVAQHVETLRLLAQAERYRHQAEDVSRRLTVEGWNEYFRTRREVADGFRYDRDKVQPLNGNGNQIAETALTHPLVIHNQPVGLMMVDTQNGMDADTTELVAAIAERLSDHIENLRLLEETQEQRVQLSEALNIAKLGYWEYDLERDRFTFNDQFYSLFRTTAKQVGGYELSSADYARLFVHPEDAPLVGTEIERALASTERFFTAKVEHRAVFPDGEIGYISVDINLERDENGKITRWYGANQDITERKKAELAVVESEKRLQSVLDTLPVAIAISRTSDGMLMYHNPAFTSLVGYSEEDLNGKSTPDFYYSLEDRATLFKDLGERGSLNNYELKVKHFDGHLIWTLLNVFPAQFAGENCIVLGAVDVTQRKKIEEAMGKRASQLETVAVLSTTTSTVLEPDALLQEVVDLTKERFDLYHAHIYLADDDASSLSLSAGAGKIGEEMVGKGHSISTDVEKSLVARAFRERRAILVNDTASQPDFLPNPLLPNTRSEMAVPMIVGDTVLGVFDVQSDVVDGFTREDANIYTTLASQVAVALQNARLYVSQAATLTQLRELDRLKSAFLANMSHELRTPLNSILGFTDVMLEGLDGDLTEYMDNDLRLIQKNGRHLLHLINDVLDMAKIESGRMNLHPELFRVHELLEEVFSITAPLASEKNISLLIEEDSDSSIEVYADNTRIRQVMINLVNNSIKFTERGKISLSVKLIDGARALIAVKDTGIGIPQDHLESVFYEFTQVDTSTTRKVGGTGLGLPISRRLIEMHGGRLWAESTGVSGEGSTFFVELPLEAQVSDVIEKQESEA